MSGSRGVALVLALMAVTLLAALGLSLSVLTSVEARIAGNYSQAYEARSAAESALEFAVYALQTIPDWDAVAAGAVTSTFVDGPAEGARQLSDGSSVNLTLLTSTLGQPGLRLFAYGPLSELTGRPSILYIIVWVGPDPEGREGTMLLRADAFGPAGMRRAAQARVSHAAVLSWSSR
jgi:hypothetical protein